MDLSVIIVSYNTCRLTLNAIESVFQSRTRYSYEVIVVDNHSTDGSVSMIREKFPAVKVISNERNEGFSKANNRGIRISRGRYVLLLNSDTVIEPDTLEIMIRFMDEHPDVGAAGCKVVLPDGSLDKACRRGFPTPSASFYYAFGISKLFPKHPRFNQYQLSYLDPDQDYPVDCLVGAFMMVRRETIDQVGLLDEQFFMYGEDIDWCYRIKQAGWQIYYYPHTRIVHYKGASSRRKPRRIIYEFHRAMVIFHRKHYQARYSWFVNALVYAGIYVKLAMALVLNRFGSVR
mgnify:CR=1 FL=1